MRSLRPAAPVAKDAKPQGERIVPWHEHEPAAVAERLGVEPSTGLHADEAMRRLAEHGPNRLQESRGRHPLRMLLDPFADLMVLVLLAAALVAGAVGEPKDALVIVAIVVLNAALSFVQEYRAARALAALRALAAPSARVRRGGALATVPAAELVPGDVVRLEAGAIVPADLRLVEAQRLRVDESALTGESQPVDKQVGALAGGQVALGDRVNLAFKGTVATLGRGEGLVVGTGMRTELGRVANLLSEAEDTRTPLQRRLRRFASQLAVLVLVLCGVIFALGLLRGEPPLLMFLTALSLAVAAMPEALPAVVTVSLALGARRMVARNALVRRLPAVETLGSVTTICSDKTGTLTENKMEVANVRCPPFVPEGGAACGPQEPCGALLRAMLLNSDATVAADGSVEGDPTEAAILRRALASAPDGSAVRAAHPRRGELPFSSERGRMTTLHGTGSGQRFLVTKGAPERVLERCTRQASGEQILALDRPAALDSAKALAAGGLRVLAFATRDGFEPESPDLDESAEAELTLLGFVGLLDPPRPEAREAVAECQGAGIRVVMITGDHPATAAAIARQLGISAADGPEPMTGEALAHLDEDAFHERVGELRVYARVAPEQKLRIVRALQARGEFAAMTGDGVNDAPALRQADIGVAMGRAGTDVAREAADMVLVDDDFASIVAAVREGRRIYDNVRKFIRYILTGNSAEIWVLFLAPWFGLPLPLLPIHILWINLVTDGLPGLALAVEPAERAVMRRPPRPPNESVFAHGLLWHALWVGLLMGGVSLCAQGWAWHGGSENWQTMTFTVLSLAQLAHVLVVRSERVSLLRLGLRGNLPLTLAVGGTVLLQLATLYVPLLNDVLSTRPLALRELLLCFALALLPALAVEGEKWLVRRG